MSLNVDTRSKALLQGAIDTHMHTGPDIYPRSVTVIEAAKRRGKEELGVEVDFRDLGAFYYFAPHSDSAENEYCHVLIGKTKKVVEPNPVEISEIKKMDCNQITEELRKHPNAFTPWFKLSLEKFDLEKYL